jgi:hypothetical protein
VDESPAGDDRVGHRVLELAVFREYRMSHRLILSAAALPQHRPGRFRWVRSTLVVGGTCVLLAGCGGDEAASLPTASGTEDGKPAVAAADEAQASELCSQAHADWPYGDVDVPGDADLICAAP